MCNASLNNQGCNWCLLSNTTNMYNSSTGMWFADMVRVAKGTKIHTIKYDIAVPVKPENTL